MALYLSLVIWLGMRSYRFIAGAVAGGSGAGMGYVAALPTLFLLIFLGKALFFRQREGNARSFLVTPEEQPALFEFLNRLADETGAPRPHKVFLSPDVNAAVFYDVSALNLFLPSRKNLRIGLGLVNVLSLSELKAVLAHEFGHFGQRAMAVGSWAYTAQRIASHIVHRRDAMDRLLLSFSGIDIRVAWIGWIMRIIVWSLRSVLDTAFALAVLAERALSRKMEFQADLVAVSLTGSDALVHALHKLGPADSALDQAVGVVMGEHSADRMVGDLFLLQTEIMTRTRTVLAEPNYGVAPPVPAQAPEAHRVFEKRMAQPPRMWSSHPPNEEREENAKRIYVPAAKDERSAWDLFREAAELRKRMTSFLVDAIVNDPEAPKRPPSTVAPVPVDGLAAVAEQFDRIHFDPAYRGAYLKRSVVRAARTADDLYPKPLPAREQWDTPYSDAMVAAMARLKAVDEEYNMLLGLQRGLLETGKGTIKFRGRVLRRKALPSVLETLKAEREVCRQEVATHDQRVRGIHMAAAESIGQGWPEHLRSAAVLLHYADHTEADLNDAAASYGNVLEIVTADGRVSSSEVERLCAAGTILQNALEAIHQQASAVVLCQTAQERLEVSTWKEALPAQFELPYPSKQNIGDWTGAIGSWRAAFGRALDVLERSALDHLLESERKVMRMARGEEPVVPAPAVAAVPARYTTLLPGCEREKQWKLGWWDRFQLADGVFPTVARFAVAGSVVGLVVWTAGAVDRVTVAIHNGLNRNVMIELGDREVELAGYESTQVTLPFHSTLPVAARTQRGEPIETFVAELPHSMGTYVYNVAGADALVRWTAVYGNVLAMPERSMGAPRWTETDAEILFQEPPRSVKTKGGGATRRVLSAPGATPSAVLALLKNADERRALIEMHARWDDADRRESLEWIERAARLPSAESVARERLHRAPGDVLASRLLQDGTHGAVHATVCRQFSEDNRKQETAQSIYLAIRCTEESAEQDRAFIAAYEKYPDYPWLVQAAAYALLAAGQSQEALNAFVKRCQHGPTPEHVVMDTARLLRAAGRGREAEQLRRLSPSLAEMLALEDRSPKSALGQAYSALGRGELEAALDPKLDKDDKNRLLRLVAASRNAPTRVIDEAMRLSTDDGLDPDTLWSSIGLVLRRKGDVAPLRAAMPRMVPANELARLQSCVDAVASNARTAVLDELASGLPPALRGQVLGMAVVAQGDKAPTAWRNTARDLLFVYERPAL
jgi:Zn-dependent protease with chaperone function/tetratricopeptide (TPR) repeat protein